MGEREEVEVESERCAAKLPTRARKTRHCAENAALATFGKRTRR